MVAQRPLALIGPTVGNQERKTPGDYTGSLSCCRSCTSRSRFTNRDDSLLARNTCVSQNLHWYFATMTGTLNWAGLHHALAAQTVCLLLAGGLKSLSAKLFKNSAHSSNGHLCFCLTGNEWLCCTLQSPPKLVVLLEKTWLKFTTSFYCLVISLKAVFPLVIISYKDSKVHKEWGSLPSRKTNI